MPMVIALRCYVVDEHVFWNAGREVSLERIHQESVALRDRIDERSDRPYTPGSGMMLYPKGGPVDDANLDIIRR